MVFCVSSFVVFGLSSLTHKHNDKVAFENIYITAAHALSWMLISLERHYMFSASKTPAIVISHPLAVMEL